MRNAVFLVCIFGAKAELEDNRTGVMNHRQGRTFLLPFLGYLLSSVLGEPPVNYISNYESNPWLQYYNDNKHPHYPDSYYRRPSSPWYPVINPLPYPPPAITYGPPTFTSPNPPENHPNQQLINYPDHDFTYYENTPSISTNIEIPPGFGEEYAGSNQNIRRQKYDTKRKVTEKPKKYNKKRGIERPTRKKNKRRRTTPAYYDSYEEVTTKRHKVNKKKLTTRKYQKKRRPSTAVYDDYSGYSTTKRYSKKSANHRRRRPVKTKHKKRDEYYDDYSSTESEYSSEYDSLEYSEEVVDEDEEGVANVVTVDHSVLLARQGSSSTTAGTTTTTTTEAPSSSTTTEATTTTTTSSNMTTTNGYGQQTGNENISITYVPPRNNYDYQYPTFTGYGPSNGNENISITYGPPTAEQRYDYQVPYIDWYSHFATRNAVLKKVHEIVNDNDFYSRFNKDKLTSYHENI